MKRLVFVVLLLVVISAYLTGCGDSQEVTTTISYNESQIDLSDYPVDFRNTFGPYMGYDMVDVDLYSLLDLIVSENETNISKVYVQLETDIETVIKATTDEESISFIPVMVEGCTSYDIYPYRDDFDDIVIKIVAKYE